MAAMSKGHIRSASRIAGRGALLRSLRGLIGRIRRYGEHRAATADEQRWTAKLYDELEAAYLAALSVPAARASLTAYDERRRRSCKVPSNATRSNDEKTVPALSFVTRHE
jgi:hypothetical protein